MVEEVPTDTYHFESEENLSDAIREAVAAERGDDPSDIDVHLYDDIDPDALDALLRKDAKPTTAVELHTNRVEVKLWADGDFEVQVLDEEAET